MGYINVEATYKGSPVKHKSALQQLLKEDPEEVLFYSTELFGQFNGTASQIPPGTILSVRGPGGGKPNKWYGTIRVTDGKVVMT